MADFEVKNVLVPTDFSPVADSALLTAVQICKRHSAKLTLLHAVENDFALFAPSAGIAGSHVLPDLMENAKNSLGAKSAEIQREHDVEIATIVAPGHPSHQVNNFIKEKDIDLVCMGTHGSSGIRALLLGSTAYRVIKHSPCPVLTIPGTSPLLHFRKILFPVRLVPHALDKYDVVKPILAKNGSWIHVAGIITLDDTAGMPELNQLITQVRNKMSLDNIDCATDVHICSNAARQVHDLANAEKPDLIVITATVDTSVKDFFLNPFTQSMVSKSHYPVLSIKPREFPPMERTLQEVDTLDLTLA